MNTEQIKTQANALFTQASFIAAIRSEAEHEQALELMESLIEDYDGQALWFKSQSICVKWHVQNLKTQYLFYACNNNRIKKSPFNRVKKHQWQRIIIEKALY